MGTIKSINVNGKRYSFDNSGIEILPIKSDKADLDIADENGNVIAEFKDGHVKIKNFDSRPSTETRRFNYQGIKLDLRQNSIDYSIVARLGYSLQSATACDKYMIVCFNTHDHMMIYKTEDFSFVQRIDLTAVSNWHSNNCSFGNYYDKSDPIPLLYVSQQRGATPCTLVYRITGVEGSFVFNLIQTISHPTDLANFMYYGDSVVDTDHNCLWFNGYKINSYTDMSDSNAIKIMKFDLPEPTTGDVSLSLDDKRDEFLLPPQFATQGCIYYAGKIYQAYGYTNQTVQIRVINLNTKAYETVIPLVDLGITEEPEGCFIHNGSLYFVGIGGNVYKFNI